MSTSKATVSMTGEARMTLNKAILLYGEQTSFATVHDIRIDKKNGGSIMMQGEPLTNSAIAQLLMHLGKSEQIGSFLPANILSVGHNSVVWWLKPATRRVFFRCDNEKTVIGIEAAETPHPGLVFAVNESTWYVFAVKGSDRPEPDTPLYLSPYFNVNEQGVICTGTTDIPRDYTAASTALWDRGFFDSAFSHPNIHPPRKLVDYKGGAYAFWRKMLDGKFKKFPEQVLVKSERTVEQFIKHVTLGGK
jgi:PRTRC genetic system protein B